MITLDEISVLLDGIAPVVHEELVERDAKIAALEHRLTALEAHYAEAAPRDSDSQTLKDTARTVAELHFSE
jgi:hypothetical protein